jgi:glycosyltransferase involved in cell wall biosynthesis
MPRVSVIMPCFNHGSFLWESAKSILNQTEEDIELLLIDDASADNSWEVIREITLSDSRCRPIQHAHNQGASKSRNDGILEANGNFIAFCDADDIWEPEKLQVQLKTMELAPSCDVAYCDSNIIDKDGSPTGALFSEMAPPPDVASGWIFDSLLVRNFINTQTVLIRKSAIVNPAMRFDERIKWVEDWWYWIQLARNHQFVYTNKPLARYRVHPKNTNIVHKRGCSINRLKVLNRTLRQYEALSKAQRARILYAMAAELNALGKQRMSRRMLSLCLRESILDFRGASVFGKALLRIATCGLLRSKAS